MWIVLNLLVLVGLVNRKKIARTMALALLVLLVAFIWRFDFHPDKFWGGIFLYFAASVGMMFLPSFNAWFNEGT